MNRFKVVLACIAVLASIAVLSGTAAAGSVTGSPRSRPASFCSDAKSAAKSLSDLNAKTDFNDASSLANGFKEASKIAKKLQKNAPSEVKSALKTLASVYDQMAKVDFNSSKALNQFTKLSRKAEGPSAKVSKYFSDKCHISIQSTTTTAG